MQIDTSRLRVTAGHDWDAGGRDVCGGAGPSVAVESEVSGFLVIALGLEDLGRWLGAYRAREISLEEWLAGEAYEAVDPLVYVTQVSIDAVEPDFESSVVRVLLTVEDWQVRQ